MKDQDAKKIIQDYLEMASEVEEVRSLDIEEHQKLLEQSRENFQKVMEELGISEKKQEELKKIGIDLLNLAQDHYFKKEYKESIDYAEKSAKIMPYDIRPLEVLLRIYSRFKGETEFQKAQEYAREILKLSPNHKQANKILQQQVYAKNPAAIMMVGIGVALLFGAGLAFFMIGKEAPPQPEVVPADNIMTEAQVAPKPVVVEPPVAEPVVEKIVDDEPLGVAPNIIPIEFENTIEGMKFDDRDSTFSFYQNSFSYQMRVLLTNQSNEEIGSISAEIKLVDKRGNIIVQTNQKLREDYEPALRPNESASLDHLIYHDGLGADYRHPVKMVLTFTKIEHVPTPESISKEDVKIDWADGKKPEQFDLKIQRRVNPSNLGSYNDFMKTYSESNVYEITNIGGGVIRDLKLREELLSRNGQVLDASESLITYSSEPYIGPNETRVKVFYGETHEKVSSIRLVVLEIE